MLHAIANGVATAEVFIQVAIGSLTWSAALTIATADVKAAAWPILSIKRFQFRVELRMPFRRPQLFKEALRCHGEELGGVGSYSSRTVGRPSQLSRLSRSYSALSTRAHATY